MSNAISNVKPNLHLYYSIIKAELLIVRDRLEDPAAWIKGEAARDAKGSPVHHSDPDAVCWCLSGALTRVTQSTWASITQDYALSYVWAKYEMGLAAYNDAPERTHAEVLALLDDMLEDVSTKLETVMSYG